MRLALVLAACAIGCGRSTAEPSTAPEPPCDGRRAILRTTFRDVRMIDVGCVDGNPVVRFSDTHLTGGRVAERPMSLEDWQIFWSPFEAYWPATKTWCLRRDPTITHAQMIELTVRLDGSSRWLACRVHELPDVGAFVTALTEQAQPWIESASVSAEQVPWRIAQASVGAVSVGMSAERLRAVEGLAIRSSRDGRELDGWIDGAHQLTLFLDEDGDTIERIRVGGTTPRLAPDRAGWAPGVGTTALDLAEHLGYPAEFDEDTRCVRFPDHVARFCFATRVTSWQALLAQNPRATSLWL